MPRKDKTNHNVIKHKCTSNMCDPCKKQKQQKTGMVCMCNHAVWTGFLAGNLRRSNIQGYYGSYRKTITILWDWENDQNGV